MQKQAECREHRLGSTGATCMFPTSPPNPRLLGVSRLLHPPDPATQAASLLVILDQELSTGTGQEWSELAHRIKQIPTENLSGGAGSCAASAPPAIFCFPLTSAQSGILALPYFERMLQRCACPDLSTEGRAWPPSLLTGCLALVRQGLHH